MSILGSLRSGASVLIALWGCASAHKATPDLPPYVLDVAASPDSAIRLFRAVLEAERLPVDGSPAADVPSLSTTFRVRRGGMGEAEIVIFGRARDQRADENAHASSTLTVDASASDRGRMLTMTPEAARSPGVLLRSAHAINPNDREVRAILARLLDRLSTAGAARSTRTAGSAGASRTPDAATRSASASATTPGEGAWQARS